MSYYLMPWPEWTIYPAVGMLGLAGACTGAYFYLWLSERKEKKRSEERLNDLRFLRDL